MRLFNRFRKQPTPQELAESELEQRKHALFLAQQALAGATREHIPPGERARRVAAVHSGDQALAAARRHLQTFYDNPSEAHRADAEAVERRRQTARYGRVAAERLRVSGVENYTLKADKTVWWDDSEKRFKPGNPVNGWLLIPTAEISSYHEYVTQDNPDRIQQVPLWHGVFLTTEGEVLAFYDLVTRRTPGMRNHPVYIPAKDEEGLRLKTYDDYRTDPAYTPKSSRLTAEDKTQQMITELLMQHGINPPDNI